MASPKNDYNELAIEKARQLNLRTSAYILSMVLVEVLEAQKEHGEENGGSAAP
jgi:hypothetical protein